MATKGVLRAVQTLLKKELDTQEKLRGIIYKREDYPLRVDQLVYDEDYHIELLDALKTIESRDEPRTPICENSPLNYELINATIDNLYRLYRIQNTLDDLANGGKYIVRAEMKVSYEYREDHQKELHDILVYLESLVPQTNDN